ncbi:sodium:proton antiporter [Microvirga sp. W0021]|uniref:Sodium:proton antiporter n=1 Tax=Hohaiivirga grylli TaxID=3133970 RepID=A0ABV0BGA2_9HYPH
MQNIAAISNWFIRITFAATFCILLPEQAFAADLNGSELSILWAFPFAGMLLSIALCPLISHQLWELHMGKIAVFWALLAIVPLAVFFGPGVAWSALVHAALLEYFPFILLLLALFTVSGGIVVHGNLKGTPGLNTAMLAIGTCLASLIGTTGAAMVMIRPLIRANDDRKQNAHVIVFFIFLVANIGGSLSPLGDPPLFLGFLRGVSFFWTTVHLLPETALICAILLILFYLMDRALFKKEGVMPHDSTPERPLRITGGINFILIGVIILTIISGAAVDFGTVTIADNQIDITNLMRDFVLIIVAFISMALTPKEDRETNDFNWGPITEVAKLFAGIFTAIIPVIAILNAGKDGAFAPLVALVSHADGRPNNIAYFWLTGGLSAFLDNAPTYIVFFELAGGNAQTLMTVGAKTLGAISCGAVFMGALTYIGNAPNFMVYAIARRSGIKMPNFFTYMIWSFAILLPVFLLVTLLFFI